MGLQNIIVQIELGEGLKETRIECHPLEKSIGEDDTVLMEKVYNYMITDKEDELNPTLYSPEQRRTLEIIRDNYDSVKNPSLGYKSDKGTRETIYFNEKLSSHPDMFHLGSNSQEIEYSEIKEKTQDRRVYLNAIPQDVGGKK